MDSNFNHEPLTIDRLHGWHNALFVNNRSTIYEIDIARFRGDKHGSMKIVSGPIEKEKVHYVALPASKVHEAMSKLLDYCNNSKDTPYIKSAITHLWFESIHPYDDGNGRIGRAITNHILSKEAGLDNRYYSISSAINEDKKSYYNELGKASSFTYSSKDLDITRWIEWHTKAVERAVDISLVNMEVIVEKTKFYEKIRNIPLNENQLKIIGKLIDVGHGNFEGGLTTKKYMSITKVSQRMTAIRQIDDMVKKGVLYKVPGYEGKNIRYDIAVDGINIEKGSR
jgi:Fic family protein